MEIWAHRGRSTPSSQGNTYLDFARCNQHGVNGIETDICMTPDGKVIICHPGTLTPDPSKMTWRGIKQSRLTVLSLNDFLVMIRSFGNVSCTLDIKMYSIDLVREAVRAISTYHLEDRVYLTTFQRKVPQFPMETDAKLLLFAKKINPKIKTHIMAVFPANLPGLVHKYSPDAISFGWLNDPPWLALVSKNVFKATASLVNLPSQVSYLKDRGIKVWGGIVNNHTDMEYLAGLGVDGLVTDDIVA